MNFDEPFESGKMPFSKGFSVMCLFICQSTIDLIAKNRYNKSKNRRTFDER